MYLNFTVRVTHNESLDTKMPYNILAYNEEVKNK